MKKLQLPLKGENLARYLNIQETMRLTQKRISYGRVPHMSYEDIVPLVGSKKHMYGSPTPSLLSDSRESLYGPSDNHEQLELLTKEEYGLRYKHVREERSDWMMDELISTNVATKNKLSRTTESSQTRMVRTGAISTAQEIMEIKQQDNQNPKEINMRLHDEISPEAEQKIYKKICNVYGMESGRRYLLVRSWTKPEEKIEAWTTTTRKQRNSHISDKTLTECPKIRSKHENKFICPDISEHVTKKMQKLVEITPYCTTNRIQVGKRWKDVLKKNPVKSRRMLHMSVKGESELSIFSSDKKSDNTPCLCGSEQCDCYIEKVKCDIPKIKTCDLARFEVDNINNYLIECREQLQDKTNQDRRVTVLQQLAVNVASRQTRESVFLQAAHDQAGNELQTFLIKHMPPGGQEVLDTGIKHVQDLANVVTQREMINEHEWRMWRYTQAKMELGENSDEMDTMDSDINSSSSSDGELSDCGIKFIKGLQPSRIPYFQETFELANTLFDKINAKLDKMVLKNHINRKMMPKKPKTVMLMEKFKLLSNDNKLFNQICKKLHALEHYSKNQIPFSERKRRKRLRANVKKMELNRKQNRRQMIEGLQSGKRYRRPKKSFLFTKKENYRGFSPRKQKFLLKAGKDKFEKCNLVGKDLSGRRLTQKVIHNDYRLIRRLFEDNSDRNKENLWDPGMKARMEEYFQISKQKPNISPPTEGNEEEDEQYASDITFDTTQRYPKKEEQKIQTAQPHDWSNWSYYSRSAGNAAGTFASMIRSLRSEAKSHATLSSESRCTPTQSLSIGSSFETSTVQPISLEPRNVWLTSEQSSDLGPSHFGGSHQVLSSKPLITPKGNLYSLGKVSSTGVCGTDSSVSQMSHLNMPTQPGKRYAKSTKTLLPIELIKANTKTIPKTNWKSSKTVT